MYHEPGPMHDKPTPPRPYSHRPRRRRWPWLLLGAALSLAAALPLLHHLGQQHLEETLRQRALQHGWTLQWQQLQLNYDLTAELRGLEATHPRGVQIQAQALRATWDWQALVREKRRQPRELALQQLSIHIKPASRGEDALAEATVDPPTGRSFSQLLQSLPVSDTRVRIQDAHILVEDLLPDRTLELSQVTLEGAPRADHWQATLGGRCAQGCGQAQAWSAQLQHSPGALEAHGTLEHPLNLPLDLPEHGLRGQARGNNLALRLSAAQKTLTLQLEDSSASLTHESLGQIEISLPSVTASTSLDSCCAPQAITLKAPEFTWHRPRATQPKQPAKEEEATPHPLARHLGRLRQLQELAGSLERFWPWLQKLHLQSATAHLPEQDLTLRGLDIQTDDEALALTLRDKAGALTLRVTPGQPDLTLQLERADIALWKERLQLTGLPAQQLTGKLSGQLTLQAQAPLPPLPPKLPAPARPIKLRQQPEQAARLHGQLTLEEGSLWIDGLSAKPIQGQRATLDLDLTYAPATANAADRLALTRLRASLPSRHSQEPVALTLTAEARSLLGAQRKPALWLRLEVPRASCQALFGAIPQAMVPRLHDQVRLTGHMSPSLEAWVDLEDPYTLDFDLKELPGSCRLLSLGRYSPKHLAQSFTHEITEGVSHAGITVGPGSSSFVPLSSLPPHVGASAFLTEEIAFYRNPGFALGLIKKALRLNLDKGRYVYGGSTVSQQLVKNLFLTRDKTLSRKLEEAFIVWKMEELLTKDRILELYLNCIEFGTDLYGIGRASWHYFNKPASRLTPLEGAFLAALKPAPWYGDRFLHKGHTPDRGWWRTRLETVMERLHEHNYISQEQQLAAAPYIVYFRGHKPPQEATDQADAANDDPEDLDAPAVAPPAPAPAPAPEAVPSEQPKPAQPQAPKKDDAPNKTKRYRWEDLPQGQP